jgi:hypothetical protein
MTFRSVIGFVLMMCLGSLILAPVGRGAACSVSAGCYGPGLGADSLANLDIGESADFVASYRFRAGHTGSLQKIHVYLIQQHAGYSSGTGGQILLTINADDGTSAHNPSSTVLASYLLADPASATPSIYFPIFEFSVPPTLVAGQLYHVVFTNVDPNYSTNYLSVDALYQINPPAQTQPMVSNVDTAVLYSHTGSPWKQLSGYTPILQLDYSDGYTGGIGYMEVWVGVPEPISGTNAVRETFTVSGAPVTVTSASVRVARSAGTDPLTVRLENSDGTLIEQQEIPASSLPLASPATYSWGTVAFSSAHTLQVGQTYHLVLASASTSTYQAYPIRKGVAYNFQNTTYFPDGYAQFYSNGSWAGWTQWGVANRTDGDLQFYFALAASTPAPTISNVAAGSLSSNSASITWNTDQSSTSQVEYGTTTSYANATNINSSMVTSHSMALSSLVASTLYHYRVLSTNSAGDQSASGDLTFTTNSAPDFTLSVTPGSQTVNPGGHTSYAVAVAALSGFTGSVTLSASGLPSGATASFSPLSVSGSGPSTLTVTTATSTATGSPTLTITGTSGSLTHTASVTLDVATLTSDPPPAPAPAYVTGNANACTAASCPVSLSNTNAGDLMIVGLFVHDSTSVNSVIDTQGNQYILIASQAWSPHNFVERLYYAKNIHGGADTATVTLSGSKYMEVRLYEYSGLDTSSPLDVSATPHTGTSVTGTAGTLTTTNAKDLLFAFFHSDDNVTNTAGTGFTAHTFPVDGYPLGEDENLSAAGSYSATMNFSASADYVGFLVAFKAAATGSP